MANALYPIFAFLGFVLVLIPLPWHLHALNSGTCLFMIWTALGCLIHFVNCLVWADNVEVHSAAWCDISTKLIVGLSVALPCASLCINRRLYSIATITQVHRTKAEKRRIIYIDVIISVGVPVIVMALHYIVQGHRFDIFENIGCWPSTVNMAPSYPLVWMWPVLIGLISMVYCVLSLHAFFRRRAEFNKLVKNNQSLSVNRYFRLMALATMEITTTTPFAVYFIYLNLTTEPISPWVSWADTKWHFSRIEVFPAWIIDANPQLKLNFNLNMWLFPACAFLFFAFFGFAEEAQRNYRILFYRILKLFGISPTTRNVPSPSHAITTSPCVQVSSVGKGSLEIPESVPQPGATADLSGIISHIITNPRDRLIVKPFIRISQAPTLSSVPKLAVYSTNNLEANHINPQDLADSARVTYIPQSNDRISTTGDAMLALPQLMVSEPDTASEVFHDNTSLSTSSSDTLPLPHTYDAVIKDSSVS